MINQANQSFITKRLFKSGLLSFLFLISNASAVAAEVEQFHSLTLPSCNVSITADRATNSNKGKIFTGNVKVLIGFANLRAQKVILIKQDNGRCLLLSESAKQINFIGG